jgi:hypothetical protein
MRSIPNTVLRGKSDEQLTQELATAEHILMVESFGFDHKARDRVQSEVFQLYNELKRRGALHSQKKAKQQQNTEAKKQGIPRPRCEHKGIPPHAATHMLGWELDSGRTWKLSCAAHKGEFGEPPYWVSKLEGLEDGKENQTETTRELLAALLDD